MFIIKLLRFIRGYLTVRFSGEVSERMLNICAANRLSLWNIKKDKNYIFASIFIKDFRRLKSVRRKSKIRIHITEKRGLPFIFKRYNRRFGFAVGLLLFVFLMWFLSDRIWTVNVCGNGVVSTEDIIEALEDIDIKIGCNRRKIDTLNAAVELENAVDGISWAALNIEGTTLTVDITETVEEKYENEGVPQNLVSICDGIIRKVELISGFSRVKPGDSVAKGDILADGCTELKDGTMIITRAEGSIIASTNRTLRHRVAFEQDDIVYGGHEQTRSVLEFFGLKIPLFFGSVDRPYLSFYSGGYKKISGKQIPIAVHKRIFFAIETVRVRLSEEEALLIARGKLRAAAQSLETEKWSLEQEEIEITDDLLILSWNINCEENIAVGEILNFSTSNP